MSENNYKNKLLLFSGVSLLVGFTTGFLTKSYYFSVNKDKDKNEYGKLYFYPCPHGDKPHEPPSPPSNTSPQVKIDTNNSFE
jgi:hypothetical protein